MGMGSIFSLKKLTQKINGVFTGLEGDKPLKSKLGLTQFEISQQLRGRAPL